MSGGWAGESNSGEVQGAKARALLEFHETEGDGFLLPKGDSSGRCHSDFFGMPGVGSWGGKFWVKWPLSGVSGSPLFLAVGLW